MDIPDILQGWRSSGGNYKYDHTLTIACMKVIKDEDNYT